MQEKDIISSIYFEHPERFADLINAYIFQGQQVIKPEDVHEIGRSKARVENNKRKFWAQTVTADVARHLHYDMQVAVILLENQSDIHYAMPVRVMNAESVHYHGQWRQMAEQHKQKKDLSGAEYLSGFAKDDKLVPVVTIVVYLGKEPWDGPICLRDMLDLSRYPIELQEMVADYPIHLLEVRKYKNLEHFQTDIRYVFGFLQRESNKEALMDYIEQYRDDFSELSEDAYNMISIMTHSEELQQILKADGKEEKFDMCQAIEEMIEDGRQQGLQQGLQQGQERLLTLVYKMSMSGEGEQLPKLYTDADFLQQMYDKYQVY